MISLLAANFLTYAAQEMPSVIEEPLVDEMPIANEEPLVNQEPSLSPDEATSNNEDTNIDEEFSASSNEKQSAPVEDQFIPRTRIVEDLSVSFPVNI